MFWRRCARGILAFLVAVGLAVSGFTALGGRAAPAVVATIPDANVPVLVAVNPTTDRVYAVNDDGTVSVIDGARNAIVTTIQVAPNGSGTFLGIAVNPATNRIYMAYSNSGGTSTLVAVIDGTTNAVTTTVSISTTCCYYVSPFGVAVNQTTGRIYVSTGSSTPGIAVIDGATDTYIATIPVSAVCCSDIELAVDPSTDLLYAMYSSKTGLVLQAFNGTTYASAGSVSLSSSVNDAGIAAAVNANTNTIYATYRSAATLVIAAINGQTDTLTGSVDLGVDAFEGFAGSLAINASTNRVYVAGTNGLLNGSLVALDGTTLAVTATIPLDGPPFGVAFNPGTGLAYAALPYNSSVAVVGEQSVGFSPNTLSFGNQPVGQAGAAQTVTLTNTGQGQVTFTGVAIAGANGGDFVKTGDTCTNTTLAPGATCVVGVAFAPGAVGNRGATLLFTDNVPGSPQSVALAGVGVPAPPGWSSWQPLGGSLADAPAAAGLDGSLYVFAEGTDHALYVRSSADGAVFSPWQPLGGILTAAPAAASANGKLYVFAKGSDNALYVMSSADGATWSGWTRLGGILTAPPAATSVNGVLYVLAKGSDNALYVMHSADGVAWSGWTDLGGILTAAPAAANLNGTLWVFAKGTDSALYAKSSADGVAFSGWQDLGGVLTAAPAAASYTPAGGVPTLYTFATGADHTLYARESTDGVTWSAWGSLGGQLVGPPAAAGAGNTLYAVVRWSDDSLYVRFVR